MIVLMTGASSFTGYHFALALLAKGHRVISTFTRPGKNYAGIRGERVARLLEAGAEPLWGADLVSEPTRQAAAQCDAFCFHHAETRLKRELSGPSAVVQAAGSALFGLDAVLERLQGKQLVFTGTYFQRPPDGIVSATPYGLSKSIVADTLALYCRLAGVCFRQFVVPHPFGPMEDEGALTSYMAREWLAGRPVLVRTPGYVRDHIPVEPLAMRYARFLEEWWLRECPSGYVMLVGDFAEMFAREMRPRFGLPCEVQCAKDQPWTEPTHVQNTDGWQRDGIRSRLNPADWDRLAGYYRDRYAPDT